MTLNYDRVWNTLNELESVTSKICSARAILDSAIVSLESGNREKTETLMYAVDEYLQYYLEEFDRKFKDAWAETVTKVHQQEYSVSSTCNNQDPSPECKSSWNSFWEDDVIKGDKVVKWVLPVQQKIEEGIDDYYVQFPDDLLEAANLKENDLVEWVDNLDGSYLLRKV